MKKFKVVLFIGLALTEPVQSQMVNSVEFAHEQLHKFSNVRDFTISDDQDEIYFTVQSPLQEISRIAYMRLEGGSWTQPQLMGFSDIYSDMEAFLSPDQTRLYFASNRPISDSSAAVKDFDIWYVERSHKKSAWSKPIPLGEPVNSKYDEFYPSLASNHNLYFTSERSQGLGKDDIYFCKWNGQSYGMPHLMDTSINGKGHEFNAFVSRDEDFIIFTKYNAQGGMGSGDLYISFKDTSGRWSSAVNLGPEVNTKSMEYCPFYDGKNGILYFTSRRSNLMPQKFKDLGHFQKTIAESANGFSKIYKIKIATILSGLHQK